MESLLVSVIIPVYNSRSFVESCVQSVLQQTHDSLEVLLIDDGSSDGSSIVLEDLAGRDRRIRVVHQENQGVSGARNTGLDLARGDWITFVDADDWLSPRFVERMLSAGLRHHADLVVGTSVLSTMAATDDDNGGSRTVGSHDCVARLLYPDIPIGCWNKLYRRDLLRSRGLRFSPELFMGEGLMFSIQAALGAGAIVLTDTADYFYRRDNQASATTALSPTKMRNALRSLECIGRLLVSEGSEVDAAFRYHCWRTHFLALVVAFQTGESRRSASVERLIGKVRGDRFRMAVSPGLHRLERARALAIAFAPVAVARLQAFRMSARSAIKSEL